MPSSISPNAKIASFTIPFNYEDIRDQNDGCVTKVSWWPEQWPEQWPKTNENKILSLLYFSALSKKKIAEQLGINADSNSLKTALSALLNRQWIERTLNVKPTSPLQKYRVTIQGKKQILNGPWH